MSRNIILIALGILSIVALLSPGCTAPSPANITATPVAGTTSPQGATATPVSIANPAVTATPEATASVTATATATPSVTVTPTSTAAATPADNPPAPTPTPAMNCRQCHPSLSNRPGHESSNQNCVACHGAQEMHLKHQSAAGVSCMSCHGSSF